MAKGNGELVRELYRAIEKGDLNEVDRLGGDAPLESVPFGETTTLRKDTENNLAAFSELKIEVRKLVEQGPTVMVEGVGRGVHTGVLRTSQGDVQPTGRRIELRFVDVYECENGRIRSCRFYADALGFLKQLGIGEQPSVGAPAATPPTH